MRRLRANHFAKVSVISFLAMAAIAVVLVLVLSSNIRSNAIDNAITEAVSDVSGPRLTAITPEDLETPMTGERYQRFHEFVGQHIAHGATARVKLWAPDGAVIYSSDQASVGQRFPDNQNMLAALAGENAYGIKEPTDPENERERYLGTLIEVYTPITFSGAAEPQGVLEIYRYYQPTAQLISRMRGLVIVSMGGGFLVLYFVLLSGWRTYTRQQAKVTAATAALEDSEAKTRAIVNSAAEGIIVAQDGMMVFANPRAAALSGRTVEELTGRPVAELIHPDDRDLVAEPRLRGSTMRDVTRVGPVRLSRGDGGVRWVEIGAAVIAWDGGPATLSLLTDVTEMKAVEHSLTKRVSELTCLHEIARMAAEEGSSLHGLCQGVTDLLPASWQYPDVACARISVNGDVFVSGNFRATAWRQSAVIQTSEGQAGTVEVYYLEARPQADEGPFLEEERWLIDSVAERLGGIIDQESAEAALADSESKFRSIVDAAQDAIIMLDDSGAISHWNRAAEAMFGYASEEAIGTALHDLIVPERYREASTKGLDGFRQTGQGGAVGATVELSARRRDGVEFPVELSISAVRMKGRWNAVGIVRDVTERQRAEQALRESEEVHRTLIALGGSVGEAIIMLQDTEQGEGIQTFVGDGWAHITGRSQEELLGTSFFDLLHPRYREDSLRRHRKKISGEVLPKLFEMSIVGKDGAEVPIELASAATTYQGAPANVAFIRSIAERKQAERELADKASELQRANTRLREVDNLKSMFIANMSHELRTPLNSIIGFTSLMLEGMAGDISDEQRRQLEVVKGSGRHLLDLINDILDISRIEAGRVDIRAEEFSLSDLVGEVADAALPAAQASNLTVSTSVPGTIRPLTDRRRLKQILTNLVGNAVKFTESGGVRIAASVPGEGVVEVSISDTGIGIRQEDIDRLFAPFQQVDGSSTRRHQGTGLGLYLTRKLAELLGGDIQVRSEYGKGSEFTFTLPLRYGGALGNRQATSAPDAKSGASDAEPGAPVAESGTPVAEPGAPTPSPLAGRLTAG